MILSAPGHVQDFQTDPQRQVWSDLLSRAIDQAISGIRNCVGTSQYVNPAKVDVSAFQTTPIAWSGFPKLVFSQFPTREEAFAAADQPVTVSGNNVRGGRTLQDEYLEWFLHRDAQGRIVAVDFVTETRRYWTELFGMSKELAAQKYSEILGNAVDVAAISKRDGTYNPLNRFNTTDGIIHLIQPNNTLEAELDIAVQSTRQRTDDTGQPTSDVVSCSHCGDPNGLGEPGRNSDPTIAQQVNTVAQTGCFLAVPDPVGLYIEKLDLRGFAGPAGVDVSTCWKIVRGDPAVRARFQVPNGMQLSDFTVAGIPITHAGQIAEKISVFLTAAHGPAGAVQVPAAMPCSSGGGAAKAEFAFDAASFTSNIRARAS
jgi:hypothetical protein